MGLVRRIATLVLASVAGVVGVFFLVCVVNPSQMRWLGEICIRAVAPLATVAVDSDQIVSWSWGGRLLLLAVGLGHVAVALAAIWPAGLLPRRLGAISASQEGMQIHIPYAVVEDYVLKTMRRMEGIAHVKTRVEAAGEGVRVRVWAALDVAKHTVPELSERIEATLREGLDHTFGYVKVQDVTVTVTKIAPPETGAKKGEPRTVMAVDELGQSERGAQAVVAERAEEPGVRAALGSDADSSAPLTFTHTLDEERADERKGPAEDDEEQHR